MDNSVIINKNIVINFYDKKIIYDLNYTRSTVQVENREKMLKNDDKKWISII